MHPLLISNNFREFPLYSQIAEKRKKAKGEKIPEDNPEDYKKAIYVQTTKLFVELERKRRSLEEKDQVSRGSIRFKRTE